MVAGTVYLMGSHLLGRTVHAPPFEDHEILMQSQGRELTGALAHNQSNEERIARLRRLLLDRAGTAPIWGWKDPSADLYLRDVIDILPNPHFVFVVRDPAAVAGAHNVLVGQSTSDAFNAAMARYNRYWALLSEWRRPTLLVSYERGRLRPLELLEQLGKFYGVNISFELAKKVSAFISPVGGYRS